jgi:uncharacterized protein YprB with RNaseH-like and TPR domain
MKVNPYHLKKAELLKYLTGYCKHRVPYQQHPNCFLRESDFEPKRGILDIEFSSGFVANYGYILTYAIKTLGKREYYSGTITKKDIDLFNFDKNVVKKLVNDLNKYDEIITFFGTKCDIPYIRSRALRYNIDFPLYGFIRHKDIYYLVKHKLRLSSNSLESACQFLGIKGKNHINPNVWLRASHGCEKSIDKVLIHNLKDVRLTEKLYKKLILFSRKSQRSL